MKKKIRHFLTIGDLSSSELKKILKKAQSYKKNRFPTRKPLHNFTFGLLFQKASTRTRVSFEVGIRELGGSSLFLDQHSIQMERGETLVDTLLTLERYLHGVIIRNHDHQGLVEASKKIKIPLINGLSESHHPAQAVADVLTILEQFGKKRRKATPRLAYVGEANNVALSLIEICSLLRWPLIVATPRAYSFSSATLQHAMVDEKYIRLTEDPQKAVSGADVVYTDTWFSMTGGGGKDGAKKNAAKEKVFIPYQVNEELLRLASSDYVFLHCLPAYRGKEVTTEVIDGPHSQIWEQAENRLHAQKALMDFFFMKQFKKIIINY